MLRMERPSRCAFLLILLLSAPVAAQSTSGFELAGWLDGVWSRWTAPLVALWNDGRGGCDSNGGACGDSPESEALPEGRGGCDPDGGPCSTES